MPETRPMIAATGHQGRKSGLIVSPRIVFARAPVRAPAHGPQMTPTSTVPIESRYTGSRRVATICPTAILMAMATGINTHVMVLKSFPIFNQELLCFWLRMAVSLMVTSGNKYFSWDNVQRRDL